MKNGIILTEEQEMNCPLPVDILVGFMQEGILAAPECLIFLN